MDVQGLVGEGEERRDCRAEHSCESALLRAWRAVKQTRITEIMGGSRSQPERESEMQKIGFSENYPNYRGEVWCLRGGGLMPLMSLGKSVPYFCPGSQLKPLSGGLRTSVNEPPWMVGRSRQVGSRFQSLGSRFQIVLSLGQACPHESRCRWLDGAFLGRGS